MIEKLLKIGEREGFDVEIFIEEGVSLDVELDGKSLDSFEHHEGFGVGVRVKKNNKVGFSYSKELSEKVVYDAMKNLVNDKIDFAYPSKYKNPKVFSKKVLELEDKELADLLIYLRDNIIGNPLSGGVGKSVGKVRIVNSYGLDVEETYTLFSAGISTIYKDETAYEGKTRVDIFNLDEIVEKVNELAKRGVNGKKLRYKGNIILSPRALSSLLTPLKLAINAENVQRGRSVLKDKIGEQVFSEHLTIIDNGVIDYGLGSSKFDGEGIAKGETTIVEDGVLKNYIYDIKRALKEGRGSTGNASRSYSSLPYISTNNLIIRETNNKIESFDNYVYIECVIGSHTANMITGDFSVEIQNSYLYKDGEIIPIKKGLFSGNIFKLLKEALPLKGREQRGKLISPPILVEGEIIN
ncbi:TldD/PmbA family protein [Methanocaldococcus infernus]